MHINIYGFWQYSAGQYLHLLAQSLNQVETGDKSNACGLEDIDAEHWVESLLTWKEVPSERAGVQGN